jgi:hypothetical protein
VDRSSSDWLVAGLAAAAQQLHDHLPPGHPTRWLYATLRDQAHAAIATAQQADRALLEGVRKVIVTALAATGVTGGGIDLRGSVAALHTPPPHPRMPCRHPHPQPSRHPTMPRSSQNRQNRKHHHRAGWASIASASCRCSAALPSA